MSDKAASARPRQLTTASWLVVGGSAFLLLSVFDTLAGMDSVAMREEIASVLETPTGAGLGLSVSEAQAFMRAALWVAAVSAAMAAVLGVYVLQRNRGARLALSIVAVPILLTAPFTGGLLGAVVAAATAMMWSGQSRDWFAGRAVRQPVAATKVEHPGPWERTSPPQGEGGSENVPPQSGSPAGTPSASSLSTSSPSAEPAATAGFGQRQLGPVAPQPTAWISPGAAPAFATDHRGPVPVTVKVACALTWAFSGVVALLYAGMLVVLIAASDRIVELVEKSPEWERSGLQQSAVLPIVWVGCLVFLAWTLGACVLAWFTWRRHNWARWMLALSAVATMVVALFAFPVGILHQLAAALTLAGLFSRAAREWFAPRPWQPGPPSGHHPGEHSPQQYPAQQEGRGHYPGPQDPGSAPADPARPPAPSGKPPVW